MGQGKARAARPAQAPGAEKQAASGCARTAGDRAGAAERGAKGAARAGAEQVQSQSIWAPLPGRTGWARWGGRRGPH
eukprot:8287335-Pyramimonas_sp.AAC.1